MESEDEGAGGGMRAAMKKLVGAYGGEESAAPATIEKIGDKAGEMMENAAGRVLQVVDKMPDLGVGAAVAKRLMGAPEPDTRTSRQHTSEPPPPDTRQSDAGEPAPAADFEGTGGYVYRRTPEGILIVKSPDGRIDGLLVTAEGNKGAYEAITAEMEGKKKE